MSNQITFRTAAQAAIFQHEIKGQISDGMWENSPGTDWGTWCDTDVLVGSNTGRSGYVSKKGFALERLAKHDVVAGRMIDYAKLSMAFPKLDLDDLYVLDNFRTDIHTIMKYAEKSEYYQDVLKSFRKMEKLINPMNPAPCSAEGLRSVAAAVEAIEYSEKDLKDDLKEIKASMKKTWKPAEQTIAELRAENERLTSDLNEATDQLNAIRKSLKALV